MPKVILVGDVGTEHDGYQSTPVIEGSSTVRIDNRKVARVGDALEPHTDNSHPPHPRGIATGSSSVFIEGRPVAIERSEVDCGGILIASDTNVYIG